MRWVLPVVVLLVVYKFEVLLSWAHGVKSHTTWCGISHQVVWNLTPWYTLIPRHRHAALLKRPRKSRKCPNTGNLLTRSSKYNPSAIRTRWLIVHPETDNDSNQKTSGQNQNLTKIVPEDQNKRFKEGKHGIRTTLY